ncbi:MAG: hypothetical protein ICV60_04770 [Pyrinomonadaceae bacterium]|nr:hypothetical protein [Pyrinomonadaceae bacterium]
MSEKKRQKKDGQRKDKQNQAMREAVNERKQADPTEGVSNATNLSESGEGATDRARGAGGERQ